MRHSVPAAAAPGLRRVSAIALGFVLIGCANHNTAYRGSLGDFSPQSFKDAPQAQRPAPQPNPKEECGQPEPAQRLLCKGLIGGSRP
jgi:hypothetical protein